MARRENPHMSNWLRLLLSQGQKPVVDTIETVASPEELDEAEIFWIAKTREMGFPLLNVLDGGNKPPVHGMSEELKAVKAKQIGALKYWKGKKMSDELCRKFSVAQTGKKKAPRTAEHSRNNAIAHGSKCVDELGRIHLTLKDASRALGISYNNACELAKGLRISLNGHTLRKL